MQCHTVFEPKYQVAPFSGQCVCGGTTAREGAQGHLKTDQDPLWRPYGQPLRSVCVSPSPSQKLRTNFGSLGL